MIRRPPRSTLDRSSAASDVYKRQGYAAGGGYAGTGAQAVPRRQAHAGCVVPAIRHRPVSYTHLRAHETVLDLVCRLLLEKKKHHDPTISLTHTTMTANTLR